MFKHALCDELAHPWWVGRRGSRVEASRFPTTDHRLPVTMTAIVWKRSNVVTRCIESGPAHAAKSLDALNIRIQSRGFLSVRVGELALVPRH